MVRFPVLHTRLVHALGAVVVLALAPAACASDQAVPTTHDAIAPSPSLAGNYLAGRHAQATNDGQAAAMLLLHATKQDPSDTQLRRSAFVASLRAGVMPDALALARLIVDEKAPLEIAHLALAVDALRANEQGPLASHLSALDKAKTFTFLTPLLHAWFAAGNGKIEDAQSHLAGLAKRDGFAAIARVHEALIKGVMGDHAGAKQAFTEIEAETAPQTQRVVQLMGDYFHGQGDTVKAQQIYRDYLEQRPGALVIEGSLSALDKKAPAQSYVGSATDGAAEALMGLASALSQQRARETAEIFIRLALHLKPTYPTAQLLLAGLMEADGRREEADAVYGTIPSGSPISLSAMIRHADNLDRLDKTDEAIQVLRDIAAARPADPQAMMDLGDILRRHDRFAEAVGAYDEAVARIGTLSKRHWALLYTRGIALERSKDWPRAEKDFLQALEFQPDQALVLNYLGYTWVEKGMHLTKAEAMIRKAVTLRPSDGYVIDSLGWVLYQLGRPLEAVKEMERAVELRPEDPVINDHLGDVYWTVGRTREAVFQWKRALSLEPEDDLAVKIRAKIKDGLPAQGGKNG